MVRDKILETLKKTYLDSYPKLLLKVSSEIKSMGFKKLLYKDTFNDDTFFNDLTLMIGPLIGNSSYGSYISLDALFPHTDLEIFYATKNGFDADYNSFFMFDEFHREKILVKQTKQNRDGTKEEFSIEIGCYLKDRNLVIIYFPIFHSKLSLGLNNELMFGILRHLKKWIKKRKPERVNTTEKMRDLVIERFVNKAKDTIRNYDDKIRTNVKSIESYNKSIIEFIRANEVYRNAIKSLEEMVKKAKSSIYKEIEEIRKLKFVNSARLTIRGIKVDVGDIYIRYEGKDVYIGDFTILIKPDKIKIQNRKPIETKDGAVRIHPHIEDAESEYICFGSRREKIYELLASYQLKKLVYFIYLFLKSYNDADKYYSIKLWLNEDKNED